MATVKIMLKMNKVNKNNEAPVYLRITQNRKAQFLAIGVKLKVTDWNSETNKVRKTNPNYVELNAFIAQRIADAECVSVKLETKTKKISPSQIKESIVGKAPTDFFIYADNYIDTLKASGTPGLYRRSKSVIAKLKVYQNNQPLFFDEIDFAFLKKYEIYLSSKKGNRINTIHANFKIIRKIINDAVREDIMSRNDNPFYKFSMKSEPTQREYLNEKELKAIEELQLNETPKIFHHRNMFVFAAYTGGLRISDMLQLKWNNFDGIHLNIKVQKTSRQYIIKLPQKALQIIKLYRSNDSKPDHFIFPCLRNDVDYSDPTFLNRAISTNTTLTNESLKTIAMHAKVKKILSFHLSRHTFATLALKKGIRIEYVSKLLGHANIKETQIYAKIINEELDKAMDVFDL